MGWSADRIVAGDVRDGPNHFPVFRANLQTVHKETNPRYYRLIENFRELTGIALALNTSFSENEPIVCCPEEAIDCFLRAQVDLLVLENFFWSEKRNFLL